MKWSSLRERYADFRRGSTLEERNRAVAIRASKKSGDYKALREHFVKDVSRLVKPRSVVKQKGAKGVSVKRFKPRRLMLRGDPNAPGEFNMGLGNNSFFFQSGGRR